MSELVSIITSRDAAVRNRSVDKAAARLETAALLKECAALDRFWRASSNLYERVRALLFLYAIHRFHLPKRELGENSGRVPFKAVTHLLKRRYEEALESLARVEKASGPSAALSSAYAAIYKGLAFKTLADQVRRSVRSVRGNHWMSRIGHPDDYPLAIRPELLARASESDPFPILKESTPVRMDLTHSGWSDIFFLGMDYPEGARVLNVSIDLAVRDGASAKPQPPIEAYLRVIDEPVLRLTSVDLGATTDITTFAEVFDFARDYLGLLKAALIASGIVPPAMEGAMQPLRTLLEKLAGPGRGIELASIVRNIPKGSRLAVSTNLLASMIAVCMRATRQTQALTGPLAESDRRLVAARAILGEWLGGSGGGWQDSGGVWPGIKLIEGAEAREGDPEFGISRGRLLPAHHVFSREEISHQARERLEASLVLVHGGMAQDVGPILEMVTEKYLLRSPQEWRARQDAIQVLDEVLADLKAGDVRAIGHATERNFFGPIQSIIPWASNLYTERLIERARGEMGAEFWGFWMLGGMAGGGMGFIFDPARKREGQERMAAIMRESKRQLEDAVPFAMEPVVYDFAINEQGTTAELLSGAADLLPPGYYALTVPLLLRTDPKLMPRARRRELDALATASRTTEAYSGMVQSLFDRLLPSSEQKTGMQTQTLEALLNEFGFDPVEHESIRADLQNGRIGLAQNRLPVTTRIEDVRPGDVHAAYTENRALRQIGEQALAAGQVAVVSLAGGAGSRWTRGAGVVKALNPFGRFNGRWRNFIELHLAKSRRASRQSGTVVPHVVTTSYLTHAPIAKWLADTSNAGYQRLVLLSPGRSIGLRLIPTLRDLRFAWEEMTQQTLDEQKEKVRESLRTALMQWAQNAGEASDYTDNLPLQCIHPTGHWYEIPNMLRNGVLRQLLAARPQLRYLMMHNIDTTGVDLDPALLGLHIERNAALTVEVIARQVEDHGGGLARVNGRLRLVEGMALPSEELEWSLSYYNTNTFWIDIDKLLAAFELDRAALADAERVRNAVRKLAARMPSYITLKDVKRRWGKGQEDIFPVTQFEKLFVDMTALPELNCAYALVPRERGQQLKEPAQLDGWLRDGSAEYVNSLADWRE
ncbi:MAG TPA: UTP--glucose-1-phosphate uridylyltransferase [Bryobacteraceae bacterium]|nr:UTP--glucose-1-phosphate uridylyltransferase [Bryobacteraceae bacterium]